MNKDEQKKTKILELWEDIHCLLAIIAYSFNDDEVPFYIATAQTIIKKIEGEQND